MLAVVKACENGGVADHTTDQINTVLQTVLAAQLVGKTGVLESLESTPEIKNAPMKFEHQATNPRKA